MGLKSIRRRVLDGELMAGTWLNLGSSITAEIAGRAGFDWVLIDLEHGLGDHDSLVLQLQAVEGTPTAAIVRIAWNEAPRVKRALDLGPSGIMVPYVNNAAEAQNVVASMRYPPQGIRGVARFHRASGFGRDFEEYFATVNDGLLAVVQVETEEAVHRIDEIAAVDGVDVVFVGPLDLSVNLGIPQQYDHPEFRAALARVAAACGRAGKAAGILLWEPDQLDRAVAEGFRFIGLGSDGGLVTGGMRDLAAAFEKYKRVA